MTAAMQNISSVLTQVKMTERDTLAVTSKRNCVYRLLTVFQCLLLFPCFDLGEVNTGNQCLPPLKLCMFKKLSGCAFCRKNYVCALW